MGGAAVLVVKVVGVFPDVEGEEGLEAAGDGVAGALLLGDDEATVGCGGEPYPAGAEDADSASIEISPEGVETPPLLFDLAQEIAGRGGQ